MQDYQKAFIDLALEYGALQFGEFTLKSGRKSPYFFNAGRFSDSRALALVSQCIAQVLEAKNLEYDMIFGAAYKGIPLVSALATTLFNQYQRSVPVAYNRKEAKTHGEGGNLVGGPLGTNILAVDDVISAGTAITEVINLAKSNQGQLKHVIVLLDRQEVAPNSDESIITSLAKTHDIQVHSVIQLDDLMEYVKDSPSFTTYQDQLVAYRTQYGA